MFDQLNDNFHNKIASEEHRNRMISKHRILWLAHFLLCFVFASICATTFYLGYHEIAGGMLVLFLLNLMLAFRQENRSKLLLAVTALEKSFTAAQLSHQPLAFEIPAQLEAIPTAEIVTPSIEGVQEWFELKDWKVADGSSVNAGDVVAELENDEIIVEVEVMDSGQISLGAEVGSRLNSGEILATLNIALAEKAA